MSACTKARPASSSGNASKAYGRFAKRSAPALTSRTCAGVLRRTQAASGVAAAIPKARWVPTTRVLTCFMSMVLPVLGSMAGPRRTQCSRAAASCPMRSGKSTRESCLRRPGHPSRPASPGRLPRLGRASATARRGDPPRAEEAAQASGVPRHAPCGGVPVRSRPCPFPRRNPWPGHPSRPARAQQARPLPRAPSAAPGPIMDRSNRSDAEGEEARQGAGGTPTSRASPCPRHRGC